MLDHALGSRQRTNIVVSGSRCGQPCPGIYSTRSEIAVRNGRRALSTSRSGLVTARIAFFVSACGSTIFVPDIHPA
jgi:hypothetical protein